MVSREANAIFKITMEKELDDKLWNKWLHDQSEKSFEDYSNEAKGIKKVVNFAEIRNKSKNIERRMKDNGII